MGDSQKNWVGVCGLLSKTLALFMTKFAIFPTLFMTWQKNWISKLFTTVAAGTVALNIVYEGLLLRVLSIKMKSSLS